MKIVQGKPKYSEKTCPSTTLSTTNPTWLDPDSNLGLRDAKPATNRLSYGAAQEENKWIKNMFHYSFTFFVPIEIFVIITLLKYSISDLSIDFRVFQWLLVIKD
jgi:hypothetical protein